MQDPQDYVSDGIDVRNYGELSGLPAAKRLFAESLTLQDAPRGSIELNHLDIIGELRAATEEASEYETLYRTLLQAERDYRYEGLEPAWSKIAEMIVEVKSNSSKEK